MIRIEILNQKLNNIKKDVINFQNKCNHKKLLFITENNCNKVICNNCQKILPDKLQYKVS